MHTNPTTVHATYQRDQITCAGPLRIIVLLYEGAIRFSRQGLEKFEEPAARGQALGRAHRIVAELLAALEHDEGEEIAAQLDGLYQYLLGALTRATVEGDRRALTSVVSTLTTLLPAWRQLEVRSQSGDL